MSNKTNDDSQGTDLDSASEVLGDGARAHGAGDLVELLKGDVTIVLDVLLLLSVALRLVEGLDDQGGSTRNNLDLSLTVLDNELDGDTKTLVVASGFGDIIGDLLGGKTERTDLGG